MLIFPENLQKTVPRGGATGQIEQQWRQRRFLTNVAVLLSTVFAFIATMVVLDGFEATLGTPIADKTGKIIGYDTDINLSVIPGCCGLFLYLPFINLLYCGGPHLHILLAESPLGNFFERRPTLTWWTFTILCAIPFWLLPTFHLVVALFFPNSIDRTPIATPF